MAFWCTDSTFQILLEDFSFVEIFLREYNMYVLKLHLEELMLY